MNLLKLLALLKDHVHVQNGVVTLTFNILDEAKKLVAHTKTMTDDELEAFLAPYIQKLDF